MAARHLNQSPTARVPSRPKRISKRQSDIHREQAYEYFRRIRARLYKQPLFRNRYVAIRDRQIVDVGDDKFALYDRVLKRFPDERIAFARVAQEFPETIDIG